jgi:tetratricopeptide (TPR) repeat protein
LGILAIFISAAKPCVLKLITYLRRDWLRALLLAIVAVTVHAPALQGERIWDDDYLAHDSPFIKSPLLILEAFRHYLFLDSLSVHYRPVQNISFIFDYFFWNTDAYGFHLTNVLLHAASGVLLYFLLRQLFASLFLRRVSIVVRTGALASLPQISLAAFFVALIWVVHPVHSAAVDYISGRADSLAFLFASAGWLLFLRAQRAMRPLIHGWLYFLAAASGLLALFSREIACVWIVLFVAHLLFVEKNIRAHARIGALFCCGLVIAIYLACRQLPEWRPGPPSDDAIWSGSVRAALMARALGDYGRLLIFPTNLHMERTVFDPIGYRSRVDWREGIGVEYLSILGLAVLAALVFGSARRGRGQLMRIFGASWFLAGYLPVSNIVPLNATVAEHWLYLPSVGFLIFLAGCAVELPLRHWKLAVALALLATAGLSVRSHMRSTDWVTAETFYRRTFAAGGTSARNGVNLGLICVDRGDYAQAEKIFRKVLEIAPNYPIAQNDLASALSRQGKTKEAEALFALVEKSSMETRKEYPRTWIGALNLARMRHGAHDDGSALAILEGARKDYPGVWELISFESEILRKTQGPESAQRLVEDFVRANWWHYGAALALGRLYAQKGDVDLADASLRHASWLDVHDTKALRLIVLMRLRQNRLNEAFRTQRRAVARQPDEPRQYILLSDILEKMGRGAEAHAALAKASQLWALAAAN